MKGRFAKVSNWLAVLAVTVINILPYQAGAALISGGGYHTAVLKSDGNVLTWGSNNFGQIGNGSSGYYSVLTPFQVPELSGVVAVSNGRYFSAALKNDGTVWAWGANNAGQLGDGTVDSNPPQCKTTPVQSIGLSGVTAIAAGFQHMIALKNDGTIWTWGSNVSGELGYTTGGVSPVPAQVPGISNVVAIAAGEQFSMALKNDGTVWAWGENYWGALGIKTISSTSVPTQIIELTNVVAIAAADRRAMAVKSDGTVWAWGYNDAGEFGEGITAQYIRSTPIQLQSLSDVTMVSAGYYTNLALKRDGTVWIWGFDYWANTIGSGSIIPLIPNQIQNTSDIIEIETGEYQLIALKKDGTLLIWGDNRNGQLGSGNIGGYSYEPTNYSVDILPPSINITSPVSGLTNNNTPQLLYSVSDGIAVVIVDGVQVNKISGDNLDPLSDGSHTVKLGASDAVGNTNTTEVTFTVDTIPPAANINTVISPTRESSQLITGTVENGATIYITTDTSASDGYADVIGNNWSYTITGLVKGINNVTVRATDPAGNQTSIQTSIEKKGVN